MKCCYCHCRLIHDLSIKEIFWRVKKVPQLCSDCTALFQQIPEQGRCRRCAKQIMDKSKICQDCLTWQNKFPVYDFVHHAFFMYDPAFQEWLNQYKFMGDIRLSGTFAAYWKNLQKQHTEAVFCPVPLSNERLAERGFNQVSEMLVAAEVDYQMLVTRIHHSNPQAKKTRNERLASIQPFAITVDPSGIKGKTIFVIDDVYTTGQTLFHVASCLLPHQPKKIRTYSLAR